MRKVYVPVITITILAALLVVVLQRPKTTQEESPVVLPAQASQTEGAGSAPQAGQNLIHPTPASHGSQPPDPAALVWETDGYSHPGGLFQAPLPRGWEALEEADGLVRFTGPNGLPSVQVRVTNTGLDLNADAFSAFVSAQEGNTYSGYPGYQQITFSIDPENQRAVVEKRLVWNNLSGRVTSYYRGLGRAVLSVDVWPEPGKDSSATGIGTEWVDQIGVDSQTATGLEVYSSTTIHTGPDGLFRARVPTCWTRQTTHRDAAIMHTFFSPDRHVVFQVLQYDYEEPLLDAQAGGFVLALLPQLYAGDLSITANRTRADGLEYLEWKSTGGGFQGTSYFTTRGTVFLLVTVMVDTEYAEVFSSTLTELGNGFE